MALLLPAVIRSSREKLGGGKGEAERRARTFLQFVSREGTADFVRSEAPRAHNSAEKMPTVRFPVSRSPGAAHLPFSISLSFSSSKKDSIFLIEHFFDPSILDE